MGARRKAGTLRLGLLALAGVIATLLLVPSFASADVSFCPKGEGAGQCAEASIFGSPQGIATDHETGRVYFADRGNNRVNVFESDGDFLFAFGWGVDTGAAKFEKCTTASTCQAGISGSGAGQFDGPRQIAVDNVVGSPTRHEIYIGTDNSRVQRFKPDGSFVTAFGGTGPGECQISRAVDPIAVGPGGNIFVADTSGNEPNFKGRVEKFSPTGACLGETLLVEGNFLLSGLVVDSSEDAFVTVERAGGALRKYDLGAPKAMLCDLDPGIETRALTLDAAGHLFAAQGELPDKASGDAQVITEYETSCPSTKYVRRFAYGKIPSTPFGIAVLHSSKGDVYAFEGGGREIHYLDIPNPGPIVVPRSVKAGPVGNVKATLAAEINPEGKATSFHFEYLSREAFEEQGESFEGPGTKSTTPEPLVVPSDREFRVNFASALAGCAEATQQLIEEGKCLKPETEYVYRAVATNADNPTGKGVGSAQGSFTTKDAIELGDVYATGVSSAEATLNADAAPLGIPATGFFEYVDQAAWLKSGFDEATQTQQIDFGKGDGLTTGSAIVSALSPGTTYHYRLIATNPFLEAPIASEERSLTTFKPRKAEPGGCANEAFRLGAGAFLPDCRAYELVSPLDKDNGDIFIQSEGATREPAVLEQAATSGSRLAYGSYRAFGDAVSAPVTTQYLAERGEDGWQSHAITPPREHSITRNFASELDNQFRAFSPDLCEGLIVPLAEPVMAEGAEPGHRNLYRRTDRLCSDGTDTWEAISTGSPENLEGLFELVPQGRSADGEVTAFVANDNLAGAGGPPQPEGCDQSLPTPNCQLRLYVKRTGQSPLYACILPSGAIHEGSCSAGTEQGVSAFSRGRSANVANALSADGARLFWTASHVDGPIYLRQNPTEPESARLHGRAVGTGNLVGPVAATGNVAKGSANVTGLKVQSGSFAVGQEVVGSGIPAGTLVTKVQGTLLGLSKAATTTEAGVALSGVASEVIAKAIASEGAFEVGQDVSAWGGGIPRGTTIASLKELEPGVFALTLSAKATATKAGAAIDASSECTEAAAKACSYPVSEAAEEAEKTSASHFWAAAEDGSRAIFSTGSALYEYETASGATTKIASGFEGFVGASSDATRLYFASTEAIPGSGLNSQGEGAVGGQANLYLHEAGPGAGTYRFVAGLADEDVRSGAGIGRSSATAREPIGHNGRVSPSGLHATFMSVAPITGYDNTDAVSGEADNEVFLYDASANGGAGEVLCVSCNPSGARPAGGDVNHTGIAPFWVAARLPVYSSSLYAPRVLSDDGSRLFFDAQDALVLSDTNSRLDVYQWEREGKDTCDAKDPNFSPEAGGCIELISSGQSKRDSEFVDASPTGQDVFFTTLSGLLPYDYGLVDIYDARASGGLPGPPQPEPVCEGESCQGPQSFPEFSTPASSIYRGPGNLQEATKPKPYRCAKGKRRVSKGGKVRCVRKERNRHQRTRNAGGHTR